MVYRLMFHVLVYIFGVFPTVVQVPALRTFSKTDGNSAIFPLRRISYDGNSTDVGKLYATAYLDTTADSDRNS